MDSPITPDLKSQIRVLIDATACEPERANAAPSEFHKCVAIAGINDEVRAAATACNNEADGIRTRNSRIDSPMTGSVSRTKSITCKSVPQNPSSQLQNPSNTDSDLADLVDAWPKLSKAVKAGIAALVKASLLE